eukprot:6176961-Pleurochrysis_carterae.AAC.1
MMTSTAAFVCIARLCMRERVRLGSGPLDSSLLCRPRPICLQPLVAASTCILVLDVILALF